MRKYALLFVLAAGGAALLSGCREDETVDLAGYPETPAGIAIAATGKTTATYEGAYDAEGALQLSGTLSNSFTVTLAQASPEDVRILLEPIIVNLPADKVTLSASEVVIPAGHVTHSEPVEVTFDDSDMQFMADEVAAMNYELGLRIVGLDGFQVPIVASEAKVVLEKAPYVASASVVLGQGGSEQLFKRSYVDGKIVNENPIACSVKVTLDRPVLQDTRFLLKTEGLPEAFAADAAFTPAEVTIAAGEKVSEVVEWTLTDDFLLTSDEPETHRIKLTAEPIEADATVAGSKEGMDVTVIKIFDLLAFVTEPDPSWVKYPTNGWTGQTNGYGSIFDLFDGNTNTDVYVSVWGGGDGTLWFTIDMLEAHEIYGVTMASWKNTVSYMGERFVLSTSDDGETWTQQGELQTDDMRVSPYYIAFLKPVTARYIKYEGYMGKRNAPDIAEFYVYDKN